GLSGDELIASVRARHPRLPILILTMHNEAQIAQRAMRAGALGYVTKDSNPAILLTAIRKVAAGQRFLAPEIAEKIAFGECGDNDESNIEALSSRELQVMRLLADGLGVNEIARKLSISNKTVSTHKARLMEKMRFASNADIVKYAMANRLAV
ncbi:MAG TPA: response regulator transcription factor, partial [Rhodocyclaceae bacterium]|nr:response regulator transcription factor [Rhodocyclaceae bacterium]